VQKGSALVFLKRHENGVWSTTNRSSASAQNIINGNVNWFSDDRGDFQQLKVSQVERYVESQLIEEAAPPVKTSNRS